MKQLKYSEKAVLVGDDAADALIHYARVISDHGGADTVTLRVINPNGNTVEATFLLTASTVMMVESTSSDLEPPLNSEAVQDLRRRIDVIVRPAQLEPESSWAEESLKDSDIM